MVGMTSMTLFVVLDPISYREESLISWLFPRYLPYCWIQQLFPAEYFLLQGGLKAAIIRLLHEYSSGYCIIHAAYLVKSWYNSWYNSWTMCFPCSIVSNLLDTCLCVNVFRKHFCNPSITASSDQSLIGRSYLSTFLVYHSSVSPLSLVPNTLLGNRRYLRLGDHSVSTITVFLR